MRFYKNIAESIDKLSLNIKFYNTARNVKHVLFSSEVTDSKP